MSGGDFVDEAIVRRRYERSLNNFFGLYLPLADDWRVYDNSHECGSRLIAEGHGLTPAVVYEQPIWEEMMRRVGP